MNRKLIRPTLADVQGIDYTRDLQQQQLNEKQRVGQLKSLKKRARLPQRTSTSEQEIYPTVRPRHTPSDTFAEEYYYKKQMESKQPMVVILQDGEEIRGVIEWYDRGALKINRRSEPNVLLFKHNIRYMYKSSETADRPSENNKAAIASEVELVSGEYEPATDGAS
ncbi:MAG: hypothetical protein ACRD63_05895 [Pyrinomonadaceae bacterium]